MDVEKELSEIAVLLGEPGRVRMLWSLLDGEARPAGELAFFANVSAQSASLHLNKLVAAEMLKVTAHGRNRFYAIARPEVAHAVEAMAALIPSAAKNKFAPPASLRAVPEFRAARTCYDHLAGSLAVEIADALQAKNWLHLTETEFVVPADGAAFWTDFGIDLDALKKQRRVFAGKCLDWSERRYHLAGALGAAMMEELLQRRWIVRSDRTRAVRMTLAGGKNFSNLFGITI